MNQKLKRFSRTNLSYVEEMKSKLQKLDSIRNTTDAMLIQSDILQKINNKLKTSIQQKSVYSIKKQKTLQPLIYQHNLPTNKLILNKKTQFHSLLFNDQLPHISHLLSPRILNSPTNDEHAIFSRSTINPSIDSEKIPLKDKIHHEEDSQISEFPYGTTRSITPSSSTSKKSREEPPIAPDTLIIGKLYILNELYPSIEHENMNKTPLAFLGAEKLLRIRIDWNKRRYPLSSYYIEIIIDLINARPSFIREIPKVTQFNLYRPLIKTLSGHLFFDHGHNQAGTHRCDRKHIHHKFTIQDLASIHRREFYIINYNVTRERRFINLCENLFQIHHYQTKSTHWKTYLIKSKHPVNTLGVTSGASSNNPEIHHIKTLLTLNQTFSPVTPIEGSAQKRNSHSRRSISTQLSSTISSPIVQKDNTER